MKKLITAVLAAVLLLSPLLCASCGGGGNGDVTTAPVSTQGADTTGGAETSAEPYTEKDALPADMNYNETTVTVLIWKSSENEFYSDSNSGEIITSEIFNRNLKVSERMKIVLDFKEIPGNAGNAETYISTVQANSMSGDKAYDIMAGYARNAMSCAIDGLMLDINDNEFIDLEGPWYKESVINACSIGDRIFTVAGDISHSSIARVSGVFFNIDKITEYGLEDPYDLVLENKWTMEKFIEILKSGVYTDVDNSGTKNVGDSFGLVCDNIMLDCAQYAGGIRFITKDADNNPVLSEDLTGERIINLIDLWISAIDAGGMNVNNDDTKIWEAGNTVFYLYPLAYVRDERWRTLDYAYGFVPQPKFDADQPTYIASLTNYFSLWGIPSSVKNEDMSSQLIECMSSEGYHFITPAVFETAYKYKYTDDSTWRQADIFDIIRENTYCDFGKICAASLNNLPNHLFSDTVQSGYNNFKNKIAATKSQLTKALDSIVNSVS